MMFKFSRVSSVDPFVQHIRNPLLKRTWQDDKADGTYYRREWQGMKETTPIISGGMNAGTTGGQSCIHPSTIPPSFVSTFSFHRGRARCHQARSPLWRESPPSAGPGFSKAAREPRAIGCFTPRRWGERSDPSSGAPTPETIR